MSNRMKVAVLLAAVGIAAPAMAQDSVSAQTGLANTDALNAWSASDQLKPYVVDLQTITTSWGTNFGLAPIIKASRSEATFTNSLFSGQSLSNMTLTGPAPYASYSRWSNPGFGVFPNPAINAPGKPISVSGDTIQLATTFSEFGTTVGPGYNGLIGGLINYKASDSTRLYVARMGMAVNGANNTESTAQFGTGAVDASGNAYFRADDNGAGTTGEIVLQNLMRVRMRTLGAGLLGRTTSMLNVINNNIDTGADARRQQRPRLGPEAQLGHPELPERDPLRAGTGRDPRRDAGHELRHELRVRVVGEHPQLEHRAPPGALG